MYGRRTASEIREPPRAPSYSLIDLAAYLRRPVALGRINLGPEDPEWLSTVHGGCYVDAVVRNTYEGGFLYPSRLRDKSRRDSVVSSRDNPQALPTHTRGSHGHRAAVRRPPAQWNEVERDDCV